MNANILTKEEQEVKMLRVKGLSYSEIGERLGFSKQKADDICNRLGLNNMTYEKECPSCNEQFKTNNIQKKFCSERCRKNKHNRYRSPKHRCKHCGNEYRSYVKKEYCTIDCMSRVAKKKHLLKRLIYLIGLKKDCEQCGSEYIASVSNQMYCSDRCNGRAKRERNRVYYNHKCKECGKHYTTSRSKSVYCSDQCSNKYSNRHRYIMRRNRYKNNGKVDWDISVERLAKRDKRICYLCNNKVDFNDYYRDEKGYFIAGDYYPSIDHVEPISKGGTHTWDNVRLAHRICNTIKHDKNVG